MAIDNARRPSPRNPASLMVAPGYDGCNCQPYPAESTPERWRREARSTNDWPIAVPLQLDCEEHQVHSHRLLMDEFPAQGATCREVRLSLWGLPFRQSAASVLVMVPAAFRDRPPLLGTVPRGATSVPETVPRECHDRIN